MEGANGATALGASQGSEEALLLGRRAARLGLVLCLIGAAIGALGLLGWFAGIPFLTRLGPSQPQMRVNTGLSLLLLGVAAALRGRETAPRAVRLLASAAGLIALAIGFGTTVEYATGRDLGIDELLLETGGNPHPGRPSPPTAVAIALLAGASLLFDARRRARAGPPEWMILGAGLIAFVALVGAAFGAGPLYRMRTAPVVGVAVPTALGLLLISAGMLLERPGAGLARLATSPGPGGALLRRLVLPGMVLPVLLAFGLSRAFALVGIQDVALLFATLVALTTVVGLVLLMSSAAPLDRAYQALAASRAETRELIQHAPDGIFVADLDGRYTDVNRAGCEMLGYAREEIVGKTIVDLIPAEDVGRLGASKQRLLEGKAEVSEWRLLRKDATQLPVELNAKILPDGRWQAFVRDISDRKRFEDQQRVLVSLLENSSDFIGVADPTGKPIYVNPAGRRMVGLPADYPVEKTKIADYYPAEAQALVSEIFETMMERGRWSGETYFRNWQTGEAIPVSDEHFLIRDPGDDRLLGMGTVTRDITETRRAAREREELLAREQLTRQQAETANAELRESEERFRLTIDEAPIGMALVALDGRFVRVNAALCRIVGYSVEELQQLRFQDITHPDDLGSDLELLTRLTRGEIPQYQLEKRYLRKGGGAVSIMLSASILRSAEGTPRYFIAQIEDITERKRGEEALRRSEQEFRSLAESMPQIAWATRPDGWNIYFNQQWVTYTGLTLEESHGEGWITPFHPDDRQRAWEAWQRATRYRETYALECRLRRADGVYRWWLVRGVPLLGDNDEIVKWFGTCTDIEQLKAAEQRLKESEAKFSGIISISADAIISVDEDQRITLFNDGAERIFGYAPGEAIGAPLDILIPERFRAVHRQHLGAFAGGPTTSRQMGERLATILGRRKSGEEFPAEAAISKLDVGGRPILTVALRDITQRKRVEEEQRLLAEAGAVLASSLDVEQTLSTLGRLMVRDFADWCIIDLVERDERSLRRKVVSARTSQAPLAARLEELRLDRRLPHLAGPVLDSRRSLVIERVTPAKLESLSQSEEHLRILRAIDPQSIMGLPLLVHGDLFGVLILISSNPLRSYKREDLGMAEALAERAALAIENGRLYQAALHATRLRDEVLGVVAHDLRNPVAAITMAATALRRRATEGESRNIKALESIIRAAGRVNRLIADLLDVTLIEAGQLGVERARVSTRQLLTECVEAQRPLASSASLALRLDLADDLPDVWGDPHRLLQVLENLVGNAFKFTPAEGCITVGAAPREGEVLFWVADTGSGIAPEGLTHVFDRFWQARKGAHHGAGLGLPITRGIIEAHGGRIWVESTLGRGTVFFFTVPQALGAEARPSETMH
jgi:PAS domain S-box-containing protein